MSHSGRIAPVLVLIFAPDKAVNALDTLANRKHELTRLNKELVLANEDRADLRLKLFRQESELATIAQAQHVQEVLRLDWNSITDKSRIPTAEVSAAHFLFMTDLEQFKKKYEDKLSEEGRARLDALLRHIPSMRQLPFRKDGIVPPRKQLSGKVTAVASDLDLVVISIGRDAGVNESDEFTIFRGNVFVGKIIINNVDRLWSSGRVSLKGKEEPRVGDDASNNVLATPGKSGN